MADNDSQAAAEAPRRTRKALDNWERDGWSLWRIAWTVVAVVTSVVAVWGYVHHNGHPGAVWWLVIAVGIVVFWLGSEDLRWRRKYRGAGEKAAADLVALRSELQGQIDGLRGEVVALKAEPVSDHHRDQIKRIAQNVQGAVLARFACDYRDHEAQGNPSAAHFRDCLRAHCPEVVEPCDAWDVAIGDLNSAKRRLEEAVRTKASAEFNGPSWNIEGVLGCSLPRIYAALDGQQVYPVHFGPAAEYVGGWLVVGSWPLRIFGQAPTDDEISEVEATLTRFGVESALLSEGGAVTSGNLRCLDTRPVARETARAQLDRVSFPRLNGCPLCA